ncbi:uncharacterized protein T551_02593 [Pneumocystis jirovecii RU7]|uniref:AMP-activated protein kinase glycogen-binding domain-containing protein n=1 Tax=Pneumocystis jirovecii (strain RU7) TaxID=1408657 RepID=A0A0W4ZK32_PNEJ7|nr:uncharacterized protein T551_02593 [Pneumocystis jirovecii RU7]KTW28743.1 hypothetical protein T551_02593 [Pneumocystis jirovecii RU7]
MSKHTFLWKGGGKQVFVTGTFWNWEKFDELLYDSDTGIFQVTVQIPMEYDNSKIYYKYIVDSQWLVDPEMPQEADDSGNINNVFFYTINKDALSYYDDSQKLNTQGSLLTIFQHDSSDTIISTSDMVKTIYSESQEKMDIEKQENNEEEITDNSKKTLFETCSILKSDMFSFKQAFQDVASDEKYFGKSIENIINMENTNFSSEVSENIAKCVENTLFSSIKKSSTSVSSVSENISFFSHSSNCGISDLIDTDNVSLFSKQPNQEFLKNITQKSPTIQNTLDNVKTSEIEISNESQLLFNNENQSRLFSNNDTVQKLFSTNHDMFLSNFEKDSQDILKKGYQVFQSLDNDKNNKTDLFVERVDNEFLNNIDFKSASLNNTDQKVYDESSLITNKIDFSFLNIVSTAHETIKGLIASSGICGDICALTDDAHVDQDRNSSIFNLNSEEFLDNNQTNIISDTKRALIHQSGSLQASDILGKRKRFFSRLRRFFF